MLKPTGRASETQQWIITIFIIVLSLNICQATKRIAASEAVSGIPSKQTSTSEVNGCPEMCICDLSHTDELCIQDCCTDPKHELQQVLDSHSHIVSLNISRSWLTRLPYDLSNLNQLTLIELRENDLETVPNELFSLIHLNTLGLSVNRIESVPCELSKLTQLMSLDISHNRIKSITCDLSSMTKLASLDLSFNTIHSFPRLTTLTHLTSLNIDGNKREVVPCNISSLSHLTSLHLALRSTFMWELSTLTQLTSLSLSSFGLFRLQCDLSDLARLTTLHLTDSNLYKFPCQLTALIELTFLDLSDNGMVSVPCDLSNLNRLTSLTLARNNITTFPCELSTLTKLTYLDLSKNKIKSVHCDLTNLARLITLNLQGNFLVTLPCKLSTLTRLSSLDISHNYIKSVQCVLSNMTRLSSLSIKRNKLSRFPCELSTLNQLIFLDLSENIIMSVICNLSSLTHLMSLNLNRNGLSRVSPPLLTLTQLTSLSLRMNYIRSLPHGLSALTHLRVVYIVVNSLRSVPCVLSTLTQLTTLDLSYNKIKSVQCDLSNLTKLTYLNLQRNQLSQFQCKLSNLIQLTTLDLSYNTIKSVQCDLSNLTKLTYLNLQGNQLSQFPCKLSNLIQLTTLDLSYNTIKSVQLSSNGMTSVQCDLSNLTNLISLNLAQNHLSTILCNLTTLTQLVDLDISRNQIRSVQCNLSYLNKLSHLNLQGNGLQLVPSALFALTQLTYLDLSKNEIELVPRNLSTLTKLVTLNLSENLIYVLDSWLMSQAFKCTLRNFDLSNNHISKIRNYVKASATFCNKRIKAISLMNNRFTHFMDIIRGLNLKVSSDCIDFLLDQSRWNTLSCDCTDYDFYRQLQTRNESRLRQLKCHQPARLKDENPTKLPLDVFICYVSDKCPADCTCIHKPHYPKITVTCSHFNGTFLPNTIPKLPSLEYQYDIDFDYGNISKLYYRPYLSKIRTLKFSHNLISEVALDAMLALQNVSILHLDNNRLRRLPDNITTVQLKNVADVTLGQNPWVCDCTTLDTKKWMNDHAKFITDKHSVTCHSPLHMMDENMIFSDDHMFCPHEHVHGINYIITTAVFEGLIPLICISFYIMLKMRKWIADKRMVERMAHLDKMDEDREFDVFISYACEDEDYILDDFIPRLENHNFKVCCHRIHFLGGNTIIDNISECINHSKRTLVYFTKFYKDSRFCMWEFKEALNKDIREGTIRLITIKGNDLDIIDLDDSTRAYFERQTYLDFNAPRFWENLIHSLPRRIVNLREWEMQEM